MADVNAVFIVKHASDIITDGCNMKLSLSIWLIVSMKQKLLHIVRNYMFT